MAACLIGLAVLAAWRIAAPGLGHRVEHLRIGETPATLRRSAEGGPVVVVAHGFAGSRQLMAPMAVGLANAGLQVLTYDLLGHGRTAQPLPSDPVAEVMEALEAASEGLAAGTLGAEIPCGTDASPSRAAMVAQARDVIAHARTLDPRVALLSHSLGSDVLARAALCEEVAGMVGLSMFSEAVSATGPPNLLLISGAYEAFLRGAALEAVALRADAPEEGEVYGTFADGTARAAMVAPGVEHVAILYSRTAQAEAAAWLTQATGAAPREGPLDRRGPWILVLLGCAVGLVWCAAPVLPRVGERPDGLGGWRFWLAVLAPAVAAPLLITPIPLSVLPVLVADRLALLFAAHGLLSLGLQAALGGLRAPRLRLGPALVATALATLWGVGAIALIVDQTAASYVPTGPRIAVVLALLPATMLLLVPDSLLVGGRHAPPLGGVASRAAMLASLGGATLLDFSAMFFLLLISPVIVLFFLLYGSMERWIANAAGHPLPGAVASAVAFAWALGVTFPLVVR